ncbi:MAG: hypothetical protein JSR87_08320 [Proteobacteria bacterium]|nr:hypothetical protein [Pseudomonadota bacterium]MBS0572772.1 hypothetical protein [Pseudomonadota bacterium]
MKQILLATALIAVPVAGFTAFNLLASAAPAAASGQQGQPLGDLSQMTAIIADVRAIAAKGDFTAAEARISDFETLWDTGEPTLKPKNAEAWKHIDKAADAAFTTLRNGAPKAADVEQALANLQAWLSDPVTGKPVKS